MSRRSKGPRLWLRPARGDRPATWLILDGTRQRGTGCGASNFDGAKAALGAYFSKEHGRQIGSGSTRDPRDVRLADVIALYGKNIVPSLARPKEARDQLLRILDLFPGERLSDVTGHTCRAYTAKRTTPSMARHELEVLRAAINHHRKEGLHDRIVSVVLPPKPPSRDRWLTKQEAAALIRAAWRYREVQNARATDRYTRRHVARFMVVARYMGSRAAVICGASLEPKRPPGRPWVDLVNGVFYGLPTGERETKKRRQTIRVPPALLAHMRRWRARGQKYVVQWNGHPVVSISKAHRATVRDAGFGPDVTPHVWRHSLATWLMQAGGEPGDVADYLGMSEAVLLRVYRHHRPDAERRIHDLV